MLQMFNNDTNAYRNSFTNIVCASIDSCTQNYLLYCCNLQSAEKIQVMMACTKQDEWNSANQTGIEKHCFITCIIYLEFILV